MIDAEAARGARTPSAADADVARNHSERNHAAALAADEPVCARFERLAAPVLTLVPSVGRAGERNEWLEPGAADAEQRRSTSNPATRSRGSATR